MPQNIVVSLQQYKISSANMFNKGYFENYADFIGKSRRKRLLYQNFLLKKKKKKTFVDKVINKRINQQKREK